MSAVPISPAGSDGAGSAVALLHAVPELGDCLEPDQARAAAEVLAVPRQDVAQGAWASSAIARAGRHAFGAIVLEGLLTRHVDIGGHPALELYGPGDLVGAEGLRQAALPAGDAWSAAVDSQLAILDDHFLVAVRRWPQLVSGLFQLGCNQHDRLLLQLVIAEQPRVEDRLLSLFWHLSERFGRVTPDGIVLPLALTHEALGRLIGARRPTVTLALQALHARGAVLRRSDRSWVVSEWPGDIALTAATLTDRTQPRPLEIAL